MITRRAGIAAGAGVIMAPLRATAQQAGKVYRIGYLSAPTRASVEHPLAAFLRALRALGWVEGQNIVIEYRWAEGNLERLPELAADLVRRRVDLIVAPAGSAALAARNATSRIPIVMMFSIDPVGVGLAASLEKPGGNVTGTTATFGLEIIGKQLQILSEAVPQASRIAFLRNPAEPAATLQRAAAQAAAQSLRVRLQVLDARSPEKFDAAFAAMARERAQALLIADSSMFLAHRDKLVELEVKGRLPTMGHFREMAESGGLMAYGVVMTEFIARAAAYVDKILRGAEPANLPIEQPTKFELVINLKTARMLGLAIPQAVLLRADEVIE